MFRLSRFVAVAAVAMALQVPFAGAAWAQASEDVRSADIHGTVPVKPGDKPVIWEVPQDTYDNGPLVTHPGGGAGGSDASRLHNTSLGMTTLGFTASDATAFRIADDFTVTAPGWTLNTITFFGYQTGSTTTSTFDVVHFQLYNGAPNGGGVIIFGDLVTNRLGSTVFSNIYRDTETTVANNQRPIMASTSTAISMSLTPATYWVDFRLGGTLASGPFIPPTTLLGMTSGGCAPCNAIQWSGAAWVALDDGAAGTQLQDIKFVIDYVPVPVELQSFRVE